jgi:ribosomal protein S18 acetylase RimI-like enzyme
MVAVRPDRQNRGLGRALVKAALSHGKHHGATRAFLAADDENKNGIHLYESLGFVPKEDEEEIAMWRGRNRRTNAEQPGES